MKDLIERIVSQAKKYPTNIAVVDNGKEYSYSEFLQLSLRFASMLSKRSDKPQVAIMLPMGINAYAAMVGTLFAGGFYCPINIDLPVYRKIQILNEFIPEIIIASSTEIQLLGPLPFDFMLVEPTKLNGDPNHNKSKYNDIAYVIFTSGSTGTPKGVVIRREPVSRFIEWAITATKVGHGDRWAQFSNLGFDLSVMDIYACLGNGGTLFPINQPIDRLLPALAIKKYRLTIWHSVPSVLDLMIKANHVVFDNLRSLRLISFCGEPLMPQHLDRLFKMNPKLEVFNTYGPTETTVFCTWISLNVDNYNNFCNTTVSIGTAIPGWKVWLHGEKALKEGEIVISGQNIGAGYWGKPELSKQKYTTIEVDGENLPTYYTGDWSEVIDGNMYFRHRIDRQVKIKGNRVELAEIDFYIREFGIVNCCSIVNNGKIYSFLETQEEIDTNPLILFLSEKLPRYSLPSRLYQIHLLPRNPNEKVDVRSLMELSSGDRSLDEPI